MKKKVSLIVVVLLICSALFGIANTLQKQIAAKNNTSDTSKQDVAVEKTNDSSVTASNKAADNTKTNQNASSNSASNTTSANSTSNAASNNKTATSSKPSSTSASSVKAAGGTSNTTKQSTSSSNQQTASTQKSATPSGPANFVILDTVHNKTIYSSRESLNGVSVADLTIKILNANGISKRTISSSEGVYFSMIAGLKERDQSVGPFSGWCFFVNGQKADIGASSYILKANDTIAWRYLQDGVSN